jgi:hypothetical protein
MLREAVNMLEMLSSPLNFASGVLVFLGGGYIALHNRNIPNWLVTCLWYMGLFGLLNSFTILVEWSQGQMHPLSHFQIGNATETLFNVSVAFTVGIMFFNTVWQDVKGAKLRHTATLKTKPAVKKVTAVKKPATIKRTRKTSSINKDVI